MLLGTLIWTVVMKVNFIISTSILEYICEWRKSIVILLYLLQLQSHSHHSRICQSLAPLEKKNFVTDFWRNINYGILLFNKNDVDLSSDKYIQFLYNQYSAYLFLLAKPRILQAVF